MIIVLKLNCFGVSAFGSLITGGASAFPRAAVGFVHALEKKLNHKGLTLGTSRKVAVGVNQFKLLMGQKNYTSSRIAMSTPWHTVKNSETKPVMDYEWKCNSKVALVITSTGGSDSAEVLQELTSVVPAMRYNNGSIFLQPKGISISIGQDADAFADVANSARINLYQFISCRSDLIDDGNEINSFIDALAFFDAEYLNEDESDQSDDDDFIGGSGPNSPVHALVDSDADSENQGDESEDNGQPSKKITWVRKHSGWIIPVERGYQAVTNPITGRPSSRDMSIPTIVASPVIGLGEFVSGRHLLTNLDLKAFWATESFDQKLFLFSASSFN